jgi:hypothetical protein
MQLQLLSRSFERKSQAVTAEVSRLWKLLRYASPELYLAFGGNHPEVNLNRNMLDTQQILGLFSEKPNVCEWKDLSEEGFFQAMGGNCKGRRALIQELRKAGACVKPLPSSMALIIQTSARLIAQLKRDQIDIAKMMDEMTKHSLPVQTMREIRGIATITSTTIIAEIIDIRRFAREDSLASYSGLGMKEHSTGETTRMVSTQSFNRRLKDAFMTAARNFILFNPDSHLSGYYRNLVKNGMHPLEATKRVARALVRVIYRKLSALPVIVETADVLAEDKKEEGESDMASGSTRSGQSHTSDMPLSSPRNDTAKKATTVKGGVPPTRKKNDSGRSKRISKKIA